VARPSAASIRLPPRTSCSTGMDGSFALEEAR